MLSTPPRSELHSRKNIWGSQMGRQGKLTIFLFIVQEERIYRSLNLRETTHKIQRRKKTEGFI
jgi:hypothetical protein